MQPFSFNMNGDHFLTIPDGGTAFHCAKDIIEGTSYPFPMGEDFRVIVDIGAHVGEFTIMAAVIWPKAKVHAFEPYPDAATVLVENMKPYPNVICHEQAVGPRAGKLPLHLSTFGSVCNSLCEDIMADPSGKAIEVDVMGVEGLAALRPDFLKIDAEGIEEALIAGLHGLGELARIRRIALEFHSEKQRRAIDEILFPTHTLIRGRIQHAAMGELTYERREPCQRPLSPTAI